MRAGKMSVRTAPDLRKKVEISIHAVLCIHRINFNIHLLDDKEYK